MPGSASQLSTWPASEAGEWLRSLPLGFVQIHCTVWSGAIVIDRGVKFAARLGIRMVASAARAGEALSKPQPSARAMAKRRRRRSMTPDSGSNADCDHPEIAHIGRGQTRTPIVKITTSLHR